MRLMAAGASIDIACIMFECKRSTFVFMALDAVFLAVGQQLLLVGAPVRIMAA